MLILDFIIAASRVTACSSLNVRAVRSVRQRHRAGADGLTPPSSSSAGTQSGGPDPAGILGVFPQLLRGASRPAPHHSRGGAHQVPRQGRARVTRPPLCKSDFCLESATHTGGRSQERANRIISHGRLTDQRPRQFDIVVVFSFLLCKPLMSCTPALRSHRLRPQHGGNLFGIRKRSLTPVRACACERAACGVSNGLLIEFQWGRDLSWDLFVDQLTSFNVTGGLLRLEMMTLCCCPFVFFPQEHVIKTILTSARDEPSAPAR